MTLELDISDVQPDIRACERVMSWNIVLICAEHILLHERYLELRVKCNSSFNTEIHNHNQSLQFSCK